MEQLIQDDSENLNFGNNIGLYLCNNKFLLLSWRKESDEENS